MQKLKLSATAALLLLLNCSPAGEHGVSTLQASGTGGGGAGAESGGQPSVVEMGGTGGQSAPALNLDLGGAPPEAAPGTTKCSVAALGNPGRNATTNFALWLSERGPVVDRYRIGTPLQGFTAESLTHYQVLLLDWLPRGAQLGMTSQQIAEWLRGGGRLIALSGYIDDVNDPLLASSLLQPLALGFDTRRNWPTSGKIVQFAPHPITAGLAGRTGFAGIAFTGGWPLLSLPDDVPLMSVGGAVVAVAALRGAGKAFVFGDEWITFDSEWAKTPEIERLWFNVFGWFGDCDLSPPTVQ